MPLPLNNPSHFLYSKSFRGQCQLVLDWRDHYSLFGLTQCANKRDIAKVYLHLARHFHPDHHRGDDEEIATKAMAKINKAREFLDAPDTYSEISDSDTNRNSSIFERFQTRVQERKKNNPPLANNDVPLSKTTDLDLLCRVYWQRIENDTDNDGMHMSLNADLMDEIKSRIEATSREIFTEKLRPYGNTLLQLIARSNEMAFFEWLLEHTPDIAFSLVQRDNNEQNFIYHALININPVARKSMFNIICSKVDSTLLCEELDFILRTTYVKDTTLDLIVNSLPDNYLRNHAASITEDNPYFLGHLARFVESTTRCRLIREALQKNPGNYCYLSTEDKTNLEYIILTFRHQHGRSQSNVDALPLQHLPISFIAAATKVWPDLENKLSLRFDNLTLGKNGYSYNNIKDSWKYKLGKADNMCALFIGNIALIVALLLVPEVALPLAIIAISTALVLAYSLYQWNNVRLHINTIAFFQDRPSTNETGLTVNPINSNGL